MDTLQYKTIPANSYSVKVLDAMEEIFGIGVAI